MYFCCVLWNFILSCVYLLCCRRSGVVFGGTGLSDSSMQHSIWCSGEIPTTYTRTSTAENYILELPRLWRRYQVTKIVMSWIEACCVILISHETSSLSYFRPHKLKHWSLLCMYGIVNCDRVSMVDIYICRFVLK